MFWGFGELYVVKCVFVVTPLTEGVMLMTDTKSSHRQLSPPPSTRASGLVNQCVFIDTRDFI